jgi:hypothetical protein
VGSPDLTLVRAVYDDTRSIPDGLVDLETDCEGYHEKQEEMKCAACCCHAGGRRILAASKRGDSETKLVQLQSIDAARSGPNSVDRRSSDCWSSLTQDVR